MIELMAAFLLVHFDAAWGWWVGYGAIFSLGLVLKVLK
jgi:hypothetical protein